MRDLLVITPSRQRAGRLREMVTASLDLAAAETDIAVCVDEDDPERVQYADLCWEMRPRVAWHCGPRQGLTGWTNVIASAAPRKYRAVASLGDDHIPRTPGWDSLLLAAIDRMGGTGIAYGDDRIFGEGLPTAPVISSDIVAALGWMCLPQCRHMAVDLAWKDLGLGAGCLAYVPEAVIEHMHPIASKAAPDRVYYDSEAGKEQDRAAWEQWQRERMAADVATIRALIERKADAAI